MIEDSFSSPLSPTIPEICPHQTLTFSPHLLSGSLNLIATISPSPPFPKYALIQPSFPPSVFSDNHSFPSDYSPNLSSLATMFSINPLVGLYFCMGVG